MNRSALTILAVLVSVQALAHQTASDETRKLQKERDRLQARKAELESELSNLEQALAQLEARLQKEGTASAASEGDSWSWGRIGSWAFVAGAMMEHKGPIKVTRQGAQWMRRPGSRRFSNQFMSCWRGHVTGGIPRPTEESQG